MVAAGALREIPCAWRDSFAGTRSFLRAARRAAAISFLRNPRRHAALRQQQHLAAAGSDRHDLYIPILTFVFGEAQLGGKGAVVSHHRLRQEFYGLPEDADLLANRLLIESVHELGHTLSLTHCHDYQCAMAPSHAVEWIDIKDSGFCEDCLSRVLQTA